MSGGHWGYQEWKLQEQADMMKDLFNTLGAAEHLMDWAICGDTSMEEEMPKLWELWKNFFDRYYNR